LCTLVYCKFYVQTSNKRKLSGNDWKNQNAKKRAQHSAAGFSSITNFVLPAEAKPSPVTGLEPLPPAQPANTVKETTS